MTLAPELEDLLNRIRNAFGVQAYARLYDVVKRYAEHAAALELAEQRIGELEAALESAENRWRLAMRRLEERFGDGLSVHKSDIEKALTALGDPREAVTGSVGSVCAEEPRRAVANSVEAGGVLGDEAGK